MVTSKRPGTDPPNKTHRSTLPDIARAPQRLGPRFVNREKPAPSRGDFGSRPVTEGPTTQSAGSSLTSSSLARPGGALREAEAKTMQQELRRSGKFRSVDSSSPTSITAVRIRCRTRHRGFSLVDRKSERPARTRPERARGEVASGPLIEHSGMDPREEMDGHQYPPPALCQWRTTIALSASRSTAANCSTVRGVSTFVDLGFLHILEGTDHLLFLLCLVIPFRRFRALVPIVSAFTVAHSTTLIASAYNLAPDALWLDPARVPRLARSSAVLRARVQFGTGESVGVLHGDLGSELDVGA